MEVRDIVHEITSDINKRNSIRESSTSARSKFKRYISALSKTARGCQSGLKDKSPMKKTRTLKKIKVNLDDSAS